MSELVRGEVFGRALIVQAIDYLFFLSARILSRSSKAAQGRRSHLKDKANAFRYSDGQARAPGNERIAPLETLPE